MPSIVRYQPVSDSSTTYHIRYEPNHNTDEPRPIEIARIDGYHYYAIPDGYTLPEQHKEITLEPVVLDEATHAMLSKVSYRVQSINDAVRDRIAERYAISDEIKLLRTAPSAEFDAWNAYAEECRAWGKAEKAKLGL